MKEWDWGYCDHEVVPGGVATIRILGSLARIGI